MNEKFKFTDALAIRDNAGEKTWVPSGEAWTEIHRLQNEFARVEEQKDAALEANQIDAIIWHQESHDKLIALQTQVLAFMTVSQLFYTGKAAYDEVQKVFAELERLAVE